MQELFFVGWVDYLKHCKWSTFLQKGRRVLMRKRTKMSNYLTQVFCGRLCVLCEYMSPKINCIGATDTCYYKMQTADCRPDTKYRLQTAEWVQNAD